MKFSSKEEVRKYVWNILKEKVVKETVTMIVLKIS